MGRKYGAEDITKCVAAVQQNEIDQRQCRRKRGYGKDGLLCAIHAKRYPNYDDAFHNRW